MDVSGEFKVAASPQKIFRALNNTEVLKRAIPNCQAVRRIAPGQFEADIIPINGNETALFLFNLHVSEIVKDREIALTWSTEAVNSLLPNGGATFKLTPHKDYTQVVHQTGMTVNKNHGEGEADKGQANIAFITALIEQFANMLRHHAGATMSNKKDKSEFDHALHSMEDAAIELEQEAETAAAKGFLGGAQMWGWLALGAVIVLLIILA